MPKTFKEYLGGVRLGNYDNIEPIASLGDLPPKGQAGKDSRGVGLHANKEYDLKDKALYYKLVRQALSVMPGSQKQKQIKKEIERVQKRLGIKEDTIEISADPNKIKNLLSKHKVKISNKEKDLFLPRGFFDLSISGSNQNLKAFSKEFYNEDIKRIPRKPGQKAGSDKHSDLYTDENPKGTIHGLGFTDAETARTSVNKIKNSGKTHAHKIQAAIAMSQRAKVASERAKDPKKKKDLGAAHKVYQSFIDTNKKKD